MLLLVLILVLVAFGLLIVALLTGNVLCAWLSVAVSVAAAVVLAVDWWQRRSAEKAGRAGAETAVSRSDPPADVRSGEDHDPVTEVLPVVAAGGEVAGAGAATSTIAPAEAAEARAGGRSDAQRTVSIPAVQPSGSGGRPSGAEAFSTPSGGSSSPRVTATPPESSAGDDGHPESEGPRGARGDAEATVVVDTRKPPTSPAAAVSPTSGSTAAPPGPPSALSSAPPSDNGASAGPRLDERSEPEPRPAEAGGDDRAATTAASGGTPPPTSAGRQPPPPTAVSGGIPPSTAASGSTPPPTASGGPPPSTAANGGAASSAVGSTAVPPPSAAAGEPGGARPPGATRVPEGDADARAAAGRPTEEPGPWSAEPEDPRTTRATTGAAAGSAGAADNGSSPADRHAGGPPPSGAPVAPPSTPAAEDDRGRGTFGGPVAASGHDLFDPVEPAGAEQAAAVEPTAAAGAADAPAVEDTEPPEEPFDPATARVVAQIADQVLVIDEQPRYHVTGCRALIAHATIPLPAREAVELGFTPCGWCTPDAVLGGQHRAGARP